MVKHPPYHLRTNKAVDRLILVKQIKAAIAAEVGLISTSTYHSLGGPFMEDLNLIHRDIPKIPLICIESNEQTHLRQKNHVFSKNLKLINETIEDFLIHTYQPITPDIFWLDFTDFDLKCLQAAQNLLSKLLPGSLLRITVAAQNPLGRFDLPNEIEDTTKEEIRASRLASFKKKFEAYLPQNFIPTESTNSQKSFNLVIQKIIQTAISESLDKSGDREFLHIQSCHYNDGTPMLSVTGLISERSKLKITEKKLNKSGLNIDKNWVAIDEVNLPFLSLQERLILNKVLPHADNPALVGEVLQATLNYHIDDSERKSIAALSQYAEYRHEYPTFVRFNV